MTVTIGRRELLAALGGAAAAWPLAVRAQQPALPVVGVLSGGSSDYPAFTRGLAESGYENGRNVRIEFVRGRYDQLRAMAQELVSRRVAVIAPMGSTRPRRRKRQPRPSPSFLCSE